MEGKDRDESDGSGEREGVGEVQLVSKASKVKEKQHRTCPVPVVKVPWGHKRPTARKCQSSMQEG